MGVVRSAALAADARAEATIAAVSIFFMSNPEYERVDSQLFKRCTIAGRG